MGRFLIVLLCWSGMIVTAHAGVYRWVDDAGRVHFSDKAPSSRAGSGEPDSQRAGVQPSSQQASGIVFPGLNGDEYLRLRKLLRARQFEILNQQLTELTRQVSRDISQEPRLVASYEAFDLGYEEMDHYFNDWVRTFPNIEYSYLARASFYSGLGWKFRALAKQTRDPVDEQRSNKFFYNALSDIDAAIGKNRQSGVAYGLLLGVAAATQERDQLRQHLDSGLQAVPGSLFIRTSYLQFLTPEWGGSARAMDQFATQAKRSEHLNRLLVFMPAYSSAMQGDHYMKRQQYRQAHQLYTRALKSGHHYEFYQKRAKADLKLRRYRDALKDFNAVTRYNSATIEAYLGQAEAYSGLGQYRNAAAELREAKKLDKNSTRLLELQDVVVMALVREAQGAKRTGNESAAMDFLNTALDLDSNSAAARYERALIHYKEQRFTDALDDATVAGQDVSRVEYFQLLDDLLSRRRFWDQLLTHWDFYLASHPKDRIALAARARIYQERDADGLVKSPVAKPSDDEAQQKERWQ